MVRMKRGASAPALHLSAASKRALLAVDLAGSDPALVSVSGGGGKRPRGSADDQDEDDGHAGWRGACFTLCFTVSTLEIGGVGRTM